MSSFSVQDSSVSYIEYMEFLKHNSKPIQFKNYEYYLKRHSFFSNIINALPCVIFILDYSSRNYLYFSEGVRYLLGWEAKDFLKNGQSWTSEKIFHPDDLAAIERYYLPALYTLSQNLSADDIKKCRLSLNYRAKNSNGKYVHLLQQTVILETDENNLPLLLLGVCNDISTHKTDNTVNYSISIYESDGEFKTLYSNITSSPFNLSAREMEIARYISDGKSNKEIADLLFLSEYTIRAHRRNIYEKTHCKNSAELTKCIIASGLTNLRFE